ncbi:MAG: PAS domain-containing protein, partial [Promethearchaeota archaeon]
MKESKVKKESDSTNLNSSRKTLNVSEALYKNIINNLIDIVIVLDLRGNFLYVSPQIYDISGFTQEEIIGKNGFKLMHPDDIKKAADVLKDAILKKNKVIIEYRTIHKDGHYINVSANGRIVNIEGEDRIFAVVRDISDQKRSEKNLKESEMKYKTLSRELEAIFDRIPAKIFRKNSKGEYTQVNQAFADTFNLNQEEIIGKTSFDFFPSDQAEKFHENDLEVIRSGEPQLNEMNVDVEGETIRLFMNKVPQFNSDGEVIGLIGVTTDNSQQIAYEREIIESEKKYRQLLEDSLEGVWIIDENAITTLVNPSMGRILGYKVEEMIGRNLFDFTPQEEVETTKNTLEKRRKGIKEEIEKKFLRKDGKKVFTRLMTSPIFNNTGKYKGAIAFVSDITERKKTEKLLKESEEKYLHLFMSSPHSIIIGDMEGNIIDCNFKEGQITGRTREELIGKKMVEVEMFPPEFLPIVMSNFKTLLTGEIPKSIEVQVIKKDGSRVWVQPSASIFKLKDKMYFQIIMQDIDNRKISEEKLRESEEKFRTLFEIVPAAITVLDLNGNIILSNQKFRDLHGIQNPSVLNGRSIREFFLESELPKLK